MRILSVFCPQNACSARAPCLFGAGTTLVWLANRACVARQQCLLRSTGWLSDGENRAFGGVGGEKFFSFGCKDFAIVLRGSEMRIFAFEILNGRAFGRKYAILVALAEQSVTLSRAVPGVAPGGESALRAFVTVAFVAAGRQWDAVWGLVIKKYNFMRLIVCVCVTLRTKFVTLRHYRFNLRVI